MGRRRGILALTAAVLVGGCVARPSAPSGVGPVVVSGKGSAPIRATTVRRQLGAAERRVRDLEAQLAARDREIAAVRGELAEATQGGGAAPLDPTAPSPAPAPQPVPPNARAPHEAPGPPALPPVDARAIPQPQPLAAAESAPLVAAQQQIAALQARLEVEVQRRQKVETEMARLLKETSAGPFERADDTVTRHLQQELTGARQEIAELRTTLRTERRQREDLERRYAALQAQVQRTDAGGTESEEIAALKARQRRVLASIQQDLEATRQRERELRDSLAYQNGGDAVSLADAVSGLRAENSALQRRLDEEHRHNRELQAKLQTATRVTDLIFKMQSGSAPPGTAAP